MKTTTNRLTLADFGELLTDAVLDAHKIKDRDGHTDRAAVADNALYIVGALAEQLADFYVGVDDLCALMGVVNACAIEANDKYAKENAERAYNALTQYIALISRVEGARAELSSFADAVDKYDRKSAEALRELRAVQSASSVGTSATGQTSGAVGSHTDKGEPTDAHGAAELAAARRTLAQYADEIEVLKGKLKQSDDRAADLNDYYAHLYNFAVCRLPENELKAHDEFKQKHRRS